MTQKAAKVGKDVAFLAVGGLVLYAGLLAIIAALIIILGTLGLPWWISALLVGLIVTGAGYFLVQKGLRALKKEDLTPRKTVESLKQDADWVKEQAK